MAQLGSVCGIAENALIVSGKKKECSVASARSNCFCASGEHEVLNSTRPSFSALELGVAVTSAPHAAAASDRATIVTSRMLRRCFMIVSSRRKRARGSTMDGPDLTTLVSFEGWLDRSDSLFSFIGAAPRTDWLPPEIEKDAKGFIRTQYLKEM